MCGRFTLRDPAKAYETYLWLETPPEKAAEHLPALLRPFPADEMESIAVSPWVNKADREGPRCLEPPEGDEPEQLSLL